jgi:hypothetical protein
MVGVSITYPSQNIRVTPDEDFDVTGVASDVGFPEPKTIVSVQVRIDHGPAKDAALRKINTNNKVTRVSFTVPAMVSEGSHSVTATATNDMDEVKTTTVRFNASTSDSTPDLQDNLFFAVDKYSDKGVSLGKYSKDRVFQSPPLPAEYVLFNVPEGAMEPHRGCVLVKCSSNVLNTPIGVDRPLRATVISDPAVDEQGRIAVTVHLDDDRVYDFTVAVEFFIVAKSAPGWKHH